VTALLEAVTRSPLAPIMAALAGVRANRGYERHFGVASPLVVADPWAWESASGFTDGTRTADLLAGPRQRWGATPHVAGALAWKSYTYWLALPAIVGYAAFRRVPLLHAGNVLVRLNGATPSLTFGVRHGIVAVLPGDPAAGRHDVRVVPDEAALRAALRASLVNQHLAPLMDQLRRHVRLGRRTLWGSLASGVAYGLKHADLAHYAPAVLETLGMADLVELGIGDDGEMSVQRRTCCLAFTVPSLPTCTGCCIR